MERLTYPVGLLAALVLAASLTASLPRAPADGTAVLVWEDAEPGCAARVELIGSPADIERVEVSDPGDGVCSVQVWFDRALPGGTAEGHTECEASRMGVTEGYAFSVSDACDPRDGGVDV